MFFSLLNGYIPHNRDSTLFTSIPICFFVPLPIPITDWRNKCAICLLKEQVKQQCGFFDPEHMLEVTPSSWQPHFF